MDSAATTLKPTVVLEATTRVLGYEYGPIHRGLYPAAEHATDLFEGGRKTIASFLGAGDDDQLVFTRSTTESINMVASGWLTPRLSAGDEVWVTELEHHANYLPWLRACRMTGANLRVLPLGDDQSLDLDRLPPVTSRLKMLAMTSVSNVLGVALPVTELAAQVRSVGAAVLVDAAQSVGHQPVDFASLGCDFLVASGHKMFGPTGVGILLGRRERLEETEPFLVGGGMVDQATTAEPVWAALPAKLEAGSPNLAGVVGLEASARYIESADKLAIKKHVETLTRQTARALDDLGGVTVYALEAGTAGHGIVSFNVDGVHPHDVGQIAGESGVALRAGHHCCQPLMQALGVDATARASLALYNDSSDVDALVAAVRTVKALFGTES